MMIRKPAWADEVVPDAGLAERQKDGQDPTAITVTCDTPVTRGTESELCGEYTYGSQACRRHSSSSRAGLI